MSNRTKNDNFYWLLVCLPLLLLAGLLGFGFTRELAAGKWVKSELARMTAEGLPYDNQSLAKAIEARTSKENSKAWQDVVAASLHLQSQWYPMSGQVVDIDAVVAKDVAWKAEPFASEMAKLGMPILRRIDEIPDNGKATWRPFVLDGTNTLHPHLSDYRSVTRLLAHEFRVAYHEGDADRALKAIELMGRAQRSADAEHIMVAKLVQMALESQQDDLIRRSLAYDFWTDEQLDRIRQLLAGRKPLEQSWQEMIDDEQVFVLAKLDDLNRQSTAQALSSESIQLCLSLFRSLREIPGVGTGDHMLMVEQKMADFFSGRGDVAPVSISSLSFANSATLLSSVTPACVAASKAFTKRNQDRNWTACAVGIKQFQLRNKRFPERLEELAQVGLTRDQWIAVTSRENGSKPFGYKVTDDQSEAILWTISHGYKPGNGIDAQPTSEPPSELQDWRDHAWQMEIRIR